MTDNTTPPPPVSDRLLDEQQFTEEEKAKHAQKRMIIAALAAYSVLALCSIVFLQLRGESPPESLISTLSVAIGAIAALAAK